MDPDAGFLAGREDLLGLVRIVGGAAFGLLKAGVAGELKPVENAHAGGQHTEQNGLVNGQPFRGAGA